MMDEQNTILIVDDAVDNLEILSEYFTRAGLRTLVATSAQAALESIRRIVPDMILLDVKMPGMDGFEMAARLKADEDTRDVPIMFVTALSDVPDKMRGLELGAVDYITKPMHLPEVAARINTHLTVRNLQKQLEVQNAQLEHEMARRARIETQRDVTLEALQESEEKYRALVENSPDGIFISDTRRFIYTNQRLREIMGFSQDEFLNMSDPLGMLVAPDERERLLGYARNRLEGNSAPDSYEVRGIRKGGDVVRLKFTVSSIVFAGQRVLQGTVQDITARVQAEQKLRESEERFAKAFHSNPSMMVITRVSDGRIVDVNASFVRVTGYSRQELVSRSTLRLKLWANPGERKRLVRLLREHEQVRDFEVKIRARSGKICPALLSGEIIHLNHEPHFLTVANDITERVRAEEKLRDSEARLALAIEATEAALFEFSPDFESFYTSPRWTEIMGYTQGELPPPDEMRRWMLELIHPDDTARMDENFSNFVEGRTERYRNEFRIRHKSKHWVWVQSNGQAIERDEQGRPTRIAGLLFDISERKQAERERLDLINKLEAQNAELERFAYTISHDLKSPLVTIQGFLGLLLEDAAAGDLERMQADAARISSAAKKMEQLLEELLELSCIGRLVNPLEEVLVGELVREALDLVAGQLQKRGVQVEIKPDLQTDAALVYGDRARLLEVLQNLVDNAVKYMGDQARPRIEIGLRRDEDGRVFYVRDNGLGIEPRYYVKVFELFDKLDPDSEGSGVGLAIVKRIVEVHGGRVWVESAGLGQGSTFCFTLADEQALNP